MIRLAVTGGVLAALLLFCFLYGVIGGRLTPARQQIIAPQAASAPVRHVLILGTSLTSRGTWVAALEKQLRLCNPDLTIERLARAGASSTWGLAALRERLKQPAPDLIIIEFSSNDSSLRHGFPLWVSRARHQAILAEAKAAHMTVFLATMSPAWGRKGWERPGQDRYRALYRDLAQEQGLGLIDTIADWNALPDAQRALWMPDNLHPTNEGMSAIIVPAFAAALRPLVCVPRG